MAFAGDMRFRDFLRDETPAGLLCVAQAKNGLWYAFPTGRGKPAYGPAPPAGALGAPASGGYPTRHEAWAAARHLEEEFLRYFGVETPEAEVRPFLRVLRPCAEMGAAN